MEIRFVRKKDIKQIVKLCELHANFEKATFDSNNKEAYLLKHFFDASDDIKCIVVENENQIVGYSTFMKQFSTWDAKYYVYLDCLFLKDKFRGKGLGTKLMNEIKKYAKIENCDLIQWQTPNFNTKAIKFYQKLGAESKSKERFFWIV